MITSQNYPKRDLAELRFSAKNLLNIQMFIQDSGIFKVSSIEQKLNMPATTLQKHFAQVRPLPIVYHRILMDFMSCYGYDNTLKYYSDNDFALLPFKFISLH